MKSPLTVVVTCTDRKSLPVDPALKLRELTDTSVRDRLEDWRSRLGAASHRIPLEKLYMGESWSQVRAVENAAVAAGFTPTFLVASAGLGLRSTAEIAPAYSATFTPRHPDSVPGDANEQRAWWNGISATTEGQRVLEEGDGPILMILSRRYADVLAEQVRGVGRTREVLVVGGSAGIGALSRLPSDRGLRRPLGGTLNSLNIRMASQWLAGVRGGQLGSPDAHQAWATWSRKHRRDEWPERRALTDAAVGSLILELLATTPRMSRTTALREVRSRGFACEQRRFAKIFAATVEVQR